MSTNSLIDRYLSHPFLEDILLADDFQKGFICFSNEFNIVKELISRNDAAIEIFKLYDKMKPEDIDSIGDLSEAGSYIHKFLHLEILMMQPTIIIHFKGNEKLIVKSLLNKYYAKIGYNIRNKSNIYSLYSIRFNVLLAAYLLKQSNCQEFNMNENIKKHYTDIFLKNSIRILDSENLTTDIISIANKMANY